MALVEGQLNYQQSPLYDTYTLAVETAVPTHIIMFADPISPTKGPELTNMKKSHELPTPEKITVMAMRMVTLGMDEVDLISLMKQYTAQLIVSGKVLLDAPIEFWPGGAGIVGVVAGPTTGVAIEEWGNGVSDPRAIASILPDLRIKIEPGETFSVELFGTTFSTAAATAGGTGVFLRCYLDGIRGRSVG